MAAKLHLEESHHVEEDHEDDEAVKKLLCSYIGLSFSIFLSFIPEKSLYLIPDLKLQVKDLSGRLNQAEEQLRQMKSRRKEDSKANARVVEIFASHRNAWQAEEKRLLNQIDAVSEEIAHLRVKLGRYEKAEVEAKGRIDELEREVGERDEMIGFMSRRSEFEEEEEEEENVYGGASVGEESGDCRSREFSVGGGGGESAEWNRNVEEVNVGYGNDYSADFSASASNFWAERGSHWQDVQYESVESMYHMKHFIARRESPWKVDGESTGVSSKLKLLEQELLNLEKVSKSDLSKVPSLLRKQAKRHQALAGKIDDLCRRMEASDPCGSNLSPEFRTQRQTEFLLEAFRLQQRASETGQKLVALQNETGKSYYGEELSQAKITTKRSLDSIRNNLKDIQRNLEIWLARIIGDLEGILARDGASRVREYYISRYPFVQ